MKLGISHPFPAPREARELEGDVGPGGDDDAGLGEDGVEGAPCDGDLDGEGVEVELELRADLVVVGLVGEEAEEVVARLGEGAVDAAEGPPAVVGRHGGRQGPLRGVLEGEAPVELARLVAEPGQEKGEKFPTF